MMMSLPGQHGDQDPLPQLEVLQGNPQVAGIGAGCELHGFGGAVSDPVQGVHHAALGVLHPPDHLEDLGRSDQLGEITLSRPMVWAMPA